ncbi:MAG: hypothetical protein ACE5PV_02050 [Candidatus Poribacteria bacterium]
MAFQAGCKCTAMGILPHTDIDRAQNLAFSMDIPFWPQLPKISYYEDMYVQASENFPGIIVDVDAKHIFLDTAKFYEDLIAYAEHQSTDSVFDISPQYSQVYHAFLAFDLQRYPAIRGQSIGPISFGLSVCDEGKRPIIYNEDVRTILFEFFRNKINMQYHALKRKNENAFMWIDEPGLEMLFTSITGYPSEKAHEEVADLLETIDGTKGIHLCGNPDWNFLLTSKIDMLSFDAYLRGEIFSKYTHQVRQFLEQGRIISWGIVPTYTEVLQEETVESLIAKLESHWRVLASENLDCRTIAKQSLIAPATCCLMNMDGAETVEKAYRMVQDISEALKEKYNLTP